MERSNKIRPWKMCIQHTDSEIAQQDHCQASGVATWQHRTIANLVIWFGPTYRSIHIVHCGELTGFGHTHRFMYIAYMDVHGRTWTRTYRKAYSALHFTLHALRCAITSSRSDSSSSSKSSLRHKKREGQVSCVQFVVDTNLRHK